jgi:hypothetical protein
MPDKRQPTLADRFMAVPAHELTASHPSRFIEHIRRGIRQAERFAFDDAAAATLAHVVHSVPDLLVREHKFAVAPFPVTWIEFPSLTYWKTLRSYMPAAYDRAGAMGAEATADTALGFLVDHDRVSMIVDGPEPASVKRSPRIHLLQYRLRAEWPLEDQLAFATLCGCSRLGLDSLLWGSTYAQLDHESRRLLRNSCAVEVVPLAGRLQQTAAQPRALEGIAAGAAGELRTLIAMLLMLNRPSLTRYSNTLAQTRGWIGNKVRPFMRHRTVTIDLDPIPMLRRIGTPHDDQQLRARHRVKGHYCENREAKDFRRIAGCVHAWVDSDVRWHPWPDAKPGEVEHWVCDSCGGKRWWRDDHERGSAAVGWVSKDYEVTS